MIEFTGVSVEYGKQTVLHDVDLTLEPGRIHVLIGPNGCGKSTLLKTADGLLPASRGSVRLDGTPLDDLSRKELARRIAYLPQSRAVSNLTVRQLVLHGRFPYLGYPRRYAKSDLEAAEQAMERVGIRHLAGRALPQLSGGERQKAYLAMALAQQTDYILLDEPTTYLDMSHQLELMKLAQQLAEQGKGVVMVLHDLNLALRCAHKLVLMEQGRVLFSGDPGQLCDSGKLEAVFGLGVGCVQTEQTGTQYYFY